MTTNNEAFEKWVDNTVLVGNPGTVAEWAWQAATTEANKRMAELESEVAIARSNENYADDQRIKCIRKYKTQITELQASNNNLREALERLKIGTCSCFTKTDQIKFHRDNCTYKIAYDGLSATPAESLALHDNEVIEKSFIATTKVIVAIENEVEIQLVASGINEVMHRLDGQYIFNAAIRALKEVK